MNSFYTVENFNCLGDIIHASTEPVQLRWPLSISVSAKFSVLKVFTRLDHWPLSKRKTLFYGFPNAMEVNSLTMTWQWPQIYLWELLKLLKITGHIKKFIKITKKLLIKKIAVNFFPAQLGLLVFYCNWSLIWLE